MIYCSVVDVIDLKPKISHDKTSSVTTAIRVFVSLITVIFGDLSDCVVDTQFDQFSWTQMKTNQL